MSKETFSRKLILHIGLPKTGSTSLQSVLRQLSLDDKLSAIEYPLIDTKVSFQHVESGNTSALGHYVRYGMKDEVHPREVTRFLEEIESACKFPGRPLMLSNEDLWVAEKGNIEVLLKVLQEKRYDIEILCCVRNFPQFWRSALSQFARSNQFDLAATRKSQEYVLRAKYWFNLGFKTTFVPYASDAISKSLQAIGEDPGILSDIENTRINQKLSYSEALLLGHVRKVLPDPDFWLIQFANEVRYSDTSNVMQSKERQKSIESQNAKVRVPDIWQLADAMKVLQDAMSKAESSDEKIFLELISDESAGLDVNVHNTPALLALDPEMQLETDEWLVGIQALSSLLIQTHTHARNLDAIIETFKAAYGFEKSGTGTFKIPLPRNLGISNLGFDSIHYFLLNPDVASSTHTAKKHYIEFGINENRFTKLQLEQQSITIPASIVLPGVKRDVATEIQQGFNDVFYRTLVNFDADPRITDPACALFLPTHLVNVNSGDTLTRILLDMSDTVLKIDELTVDEVIYHAVSQVLDFEFLGLTTRWQESLRQFYLQFEIDDVKVLENINVASQSFRMEVGSYDVKADSLDAMVLQKLNMIFDVRKLRDTDV
jgi:hypothetical protein